MSEQAHINHQNGQGAIPLLKVALAIGILAHVAGFAAFRVVDTAAPPELKQQAFIRFQNSTAQDRDRFFEEQAMLLDSEPLFLPTQWNYAARVRTETPQLAPPPLLSARLQKRSACVALISSATAQLKALSIAPS